MVSWYSTVLCTLGETLDRSTSTPEYMTEGSERSHGKHVLRMYATERRNSSAETRVLWGFPGGEGMSLLGCDR